MDRHWIENWLRIDFDNEKTLGSSWNQNSSPITLEVKIDLERTVINRIEKT